MARSSIVIDVISFAASLLITVSIFFIPIWHGSDVEDETVGQSDRLTEQTFFTLERYHIAEPAPSSRHSERPKVTHRASHSQNDIVKSEPAEIPTERAQQETDMTSHSQNETTGQLVSETGKESDSQSGSKTKKKSKNIIEYKPNWTVDKMPVYPVSARRLGQEGSVGVTAYIDKSGKVLSVIAARSSGVKSLDDAAINAVKSWKFDRLHLTDSMNVVKTEIVFRLE